MTSIMLSIHPKYAEMILDGPKTVEIRQKLPRNLHRGSRVYLYAARPVKRVVGYFYAAGASYEAPATAWGWYHNATGLSQEAFNRFVAGHKKLGFIIVCQDPPFAPVRFEEPKTLTEFGIHKAQPNFVYVDEKKAKKQ